MHRRVAVVAAVAVTLVLIGLAAFDLAGLTLESRAALDSISDVRGRVLGSGFDAAELRADSEALAAASARLVKAERRLDRYRPGLALASIVPPLARRIEGARALLAIHLTLSSAAAETLGLTARVMEQVASEANAPEGPLPALVDMLESERETIREQLAVVERASRQLDAMPQAAGGLLNVHQKAALRDTTETLRTALQAALLAPQALGSPKPMRYLLLAQKSDELRPTGGFIGNVAFVTVANGELRDLTYLRSYLVEDPTRPRVPAPAPFRRYQGMRDWNLRDANWHPDFRSSADQIVRFLALNGLEPVNGVLAFDQQALGILLAAIGPVEVPGTGVRVTSANAYTVLEHFAHSTGDRRAWFGARPFYAALSNALLETTTKRLRADPRAVLGAIQAMVAEKHLLAAFQHAGLQRLAERMGADGRLPATSDDVLYVVDAQVYRANPLTGHAALAIDYVNRNSPGDADGRLADYLRVYVPSGSRLTSTSGLADAQPARQVDGLTEFGGFLNLSGGGRQRVEFEYWLPPHLAARWSGSGYALHVPKQPGTDGHRLVVGTPQHVVFDGRLTTDVVVGARSQ